MAEAYQTNSGSFTIPEVINAFVDFLFANDPTQSTYFLHKSNNPNSTVVGWDDTDIGDTGDPIILGRTNGTTAEDLVIHMWGNREDNLGMNLSGGPYDRANATTGLWYQQTNARFGSSVTTYDQHHCQMHRNAFSNQTVVQYHFFMFDDFIFVNWKQTNDVWCSFSFGHMEKLVNFTGGAYVFCSYWSDQNGTIDVATSSFNPILCDMIGGTSIEQTNDNWHIPHFRCDKPTGEFRYCCGMSNYHYQRTSYTRYLGVNDTAGSCGGMFHGYSSPMGSFESEKITRAPSDFGLTSPLVPIYFYSGNDLQSYTWSLVGKLPNIFGMNIKDYAEVSEIDIQGNTYMVFPKARKTSAVDTGDNIPNSYYYGYCIRKPV